MSRALKRKALSGGRGFCAAVGNDRASPRASSQRRSSNRRGLGDDPVEVGRQSIGDGDSDYFGKFVGVAASDRLFDARIKLAARLDRKRDFLGRFDFPAPVIQ